MKGDEKFFTERPRRTSRCPRCRGCGTVDEPYALQPTERFKGSPRGAICAIVIGSFDIFTACREAALIANRAQRPVAFEFNEQIVVVHVDDDGDKVARDWWLKVYRETPEQTFARR